MKPQDLAALLLGEEFLTELHHLLWIEPQLNGGVHDEGLSCRDHALIVAGVAQVLGFKASMIYGRAMFVQGPSEDSAGFGLEVSPHAWVGVDGAGEYDLSLRLHNVSQYVHWKDWGVSALVGGRFAPSGRALYTSVLKPYEYETAVAAATHLNGVNSAIYHLESYVELSRDVLNQSRERCHSILSGRLEAGFGNRQDLHARAIVHFVDRLMGKGTSLVSLPQIEAWRVLAERSGDAVWRVCSRGKLA